MFQRLLRWVRNLFAEKSSSTRCIVYLTDENTCDGWYLLWSLRSRAPLSRGLDKYRFVDWFVKKFPRSSRLDIEEHMELAYYRGTDHPDYKDAADVMHNNDAGVHGERLFKEEIIVMYCNRPLLEEGSMLADYEGEFFKDE